jgi:hypothetical protein
MASTSNGASLAALLGAGVGAFAMGAVVVINETGLFVAPSLYGPAGGVSGRTTMAVLVWLASWSVLHAMWRNREVSATAVQALTLVLIGLGLIGTFPPFWSLL